MPASGFLKQSTTDTVKVGPFLDVTDGATEETGITPVVEVSKDNGAFAARNSATAITHDAEGWFDVELDTTDINTVGRLIVKAHDSTTHLPVWHEFWVLEESIFDALFATSAAAFDANQRVDVGSWLGSAVNALVSGRVDSSVGAMASAVLTATAIASNAITSAKIATDAIGSAQFAQAAADKVWSSTTRTLTAFSTALAVSVWDVLESAIATASSIGLKVKNNLDAAITSRATQADILSDATPFAGGNIDAAISSRLAENLVITRTNTAQAGGNSSELILDAGASAVDDFYVGQSAVLVSGTGAGQTGLIRGYTGSTKTAVIAPAWQTNPDGTTVFALIGVGNANVEAWKTASPTALNTFGNPVVDVSRWKGSVANNLISGRVDADIGAKTGNVALSTQEKADVNAEVDNALDTAVPASPTADSINERVKAIDELTESGGSGDLATLLSRIPDILSLANINAEVDTGFTTQIADSVPADGVLPTREQALYMIVQMLTEFAISGTTLTVKKVDGTTTLMQFTLDDDTNPTSLTRSS